MAARAVALLKEGMALGTWPAEWVLIDEACGVRRRLSATRGPRASRPNRLQVVPASLKEYNKRLLERLLVKGAGQLFFYRS